MELKNKRLLESGDLKLMKRNYKYYNIIEDIKNEIKKDFNDSIDRNDKEAIIDNFRLLELLLEVDGWYYMLPGEYFGSLKRLNVELLKDKEFILSIMKYCTQYPLDSLIYVIGSMDRGLKEDDDFMEELIKLNIFSYNFAVNKSKKQLIEVFLDCFGEKMKNDESLYKYSKLIRYLPYNIKGIDYGTNNERLKTLVIISPLRYYKKLSKEDKNDEYVKELILKLIREVDKRYYILNYLDDSIITKEFLIDCMKNGYSFYKITNSNKIKKELKEDEQLQKIAYEINNNNYKYLSEAVREEIDKRSLE